jgi:hypothetical protein
LLNIRRWVLVALAPIVAGAPPALGRDMPDLRWPGTVASRLEALASLQGLNAALLSHQSATLTLDDWCGRHHIATPAKIVAEVVHDEGKAVTPEIRAQLRAGPADLVRYRHVKLRCGGVVLSEADNWYVPARLTPAMNEALDTTDVAFGRAVQDLHFQRHTLSARLLWSPLAEGWDEADGRPVPVASGRTMTIPPHVLEHRAVLTLPDGTPFSAVVETYTGGVLGFPAPVLLER